MTDESVYTERGGQHQRHPPPPGRLPPVPRDAGTVICLLRGSVRRRTRNLRSCPWPLLWRRASGTEWGRDVTRTAALPAPRLSGHPGSSVPTSAVRLRDDHHHSGGARQPPGRAIPTHPQVTVEGGHITAMGGLTVADPAPLGVPGTARRVRSAS